MKICDFCPRAGIILTYNTFCTITISLKSIVELWPSLKGLSLATAFANPNSWAKAEADPNPLAEAKRTKQS